MLKKFDYMMSYLLLLSSSHTLPSQRTHIVHNNRTAATVAVWACGDSTSSIR